VTDDVLFKNSGTEATLTVWAGKDIYYDNRLSDGIAQSSTLTAVATDNDSLFNITFGGNSIVYGGIGGGKIFKTLTAGTLTNATVDFLGAVNTTDLSVGAGTVNFKSGTSNNARMNFTGDGTIGLDLNRTVIGALTMGTDNFGTLSLASGSQLTGAITGIKAINVVGGDSAAGVSATINGAVGVHSFSLLTNTLNITGGALTIVTDGVINTTIASPTVYGQIIVQDGYASNLGTGVSVVVTVPAGTYIPLGTLFDIVESASGTSAISTVNYAAANGYEFTIATSSEGDAVLLTSKVAAAEAVPVAAPLVSLVTAAATSSDLLGVLANINALSGSAQDDGNAQLVPSIPSLAAPLLTYQGAREFQNLWLSRLDVCGQVSWPSEDKAACKDTTARSGWWLLKGFGSFWRARCLVKL
jgi:hypothetical protein